MATEKSLDKMRAEIDRIDTAIHDLIMRRTQVVQSIGALKANRGQAVLRPAREAEILRRLVARHKGRFPRATLVRLWREIIGAMIAIEAPFKIAVYMPERGSGYLDVAHDHYGAYAETAVYRSAGAVVRAVTERSATVGIVPMPDREDDDPWWTSLMREGGDLPRIVARLPFGGPGPGRGDGLEALAIAHAVTEPTGDDRAWLAVETEPDISRAKLRAVLGAAGIEPTLMVATQRTAKAWLHLVEIAEHLASDDRRLARMVGKGEGPVLRAIVLGGYPVPMSADDLAD